MATNRSRPHHPASYVLITNLYASDYESDKQSEVTKAGGFGRHPSLLLCYSAKSARIATTWPADMAPQSQAWKLQRSSYPSAARRNATCCLELSSVECAIFHCPDVCHMCPGSSCLAASSVILERRLPGFPQQRMGTIRAPVSHRTSGRRALS